MIGGALLGLTWTRQADPHCADIPDFDPFGRLDMHVYAEPPDPEELARHARIAHRQLARAGQMRVEDWNKWKQAYEFLASNSKEGKDWEDVNTWMKSGRWEDTEEPRVWIGTEKLTWMHLQAQSCFVRTRGNEARRVAREPDKRVRGLRPWAVRSGVRERSGRRRGSEVRRREGRAGRNGAGGGIHRVGGDAGGRGHWLSRVWDRPAGGDVGALEAWCVDRNGGY